MIGPLGPLTLSARGPVAPETAWERYAQIGRWSQWSPQISAVQSDAARIAPGVTGTVRSAVGLAVGFTVDEVGEARRTWSWTVRLWPVTVRLSHAVRPTDEPTGGTETELRLHGPLPIIAAYAPLARLALGRLVRP